MQRHPLVERLRSAGIEGGTDPIAVWRRLREVEGDRATVIDLYDLVARPRGLMGWQLPVSERHALARTVLPDIWPGFATTEGSDRSGESIEVVDYDPSWPRRYKNWHDVLAARLGSVALRIEHVGSTAVPGQPAKPIIDVQISVADLEDEEAYVPPLEECGLQLRSRDHFHRYFRPFPVEPRDVHVHVCAVGSAWEYDHLLFRDYLRAHPQARETYAKTKNEAAQLWADDRAAYTDAKGEMILDMLAIAKERET